MAEGSRITEDGFYRVTESLDQRITEQFHIPIKRPERLLKMMTINRNGKKEDISSSRAGADSE